MGPEETGQDDHDVAIAAVLQGFAFQGRGMVLGDGTGDRGLRRVSHAPTVEPTTTLEELFTAHRTSLLAYARRHAADPTQAEDAVQRAFEKVWRRRPVLADLENPTAYLVTAVRNEIHRAMRRVVVERERTSSGDDTELSAVAAPGDVAVAVSVQLTVREELGRLSPREREAVVLRVQWQLDVAETAEVMGVSAGSVKSYTFHGLRKLRAALDAA